MLHIIDLSELPAIIRSNVLLELHLGLAPQVVPVHQEEYPLCTAIPDQPVDETHGCEGLAGTSCHLDKGSRVCIGKGSFKVSDCFVLAVPQTCRDEWR